LPASTLLRWTKSWKKYDYDRTEMLAILESIQEAYGYLPVAALKHVSEVSGAPYALIYGTATFYRHLRFEKPGHVVAVCLCTACLIAGSSRLVQTISREVGVTIGRGPNAGGVSLEQIPTHIRGARSPLITAGRQGAACRRRRSRRLGEGRGRRNRGMSPASILPTPPRFPRLLLPPTAPANAADLSAAISAGAFTAFRTAIEGLKAEGVIRALTESGMRGRGRGGVPIGEKWQACAVAAGDAHYVVVNAYQSDPAVLTDRVLLESNPFAVIEGAAIAAVAIGANEVIVALRAEAVETIRILEEAIAAAEAGGYLGEKRAR
jgi:NADH-quinone oxidoreductase subunit F